MDLTPEDIARWRGRWDQASKDEVWVDKNRVLDEQREKALPEIHELVSKFIDGSVPLTALREIFDRRTRNEWDLFGLKGLSGAMFLNKLVKYIPDQQRLASTLAQVVAAPDSDESGREKVFAFLAYMSEQVATGSVTKSEIQPKRASFLISGLWHAQLPQRWPIFFQTAREALEEDGLLRSGVAADEGYFEFERVFRALSQALSISFWDLEHLCARIVAAADTQSVSPRVSPLSDSADGKSQRNRVWLIAPGRNAMFFDEFFQAGIVAIGWDHLGDLTGYPDLESIRRAIEQKRGGDVSPTHDSLACFQFAFEMQVGDVVLAKRGRREVIGYGIVSSAYRFEEGRSFFKHVRSVEWKKRGSWVPSDVLVTKTLTDIGRYPKLVSELFEAIGVGTAPDTQGQVIPVDIIQVRHQPYVLDDAVRELFAPHKAIEEAIELLRYKKNLVLQGPPGVGKTFFAKRLAYLMLGEKDPDRVELVQFHQSYSYEDFVQGYRPTDDGKFARADGPFLRFCERALQDPDLPYVLIIDEINRANLSKVFGELLMLVEADKRDLSWATTLTYSRRDEPSFYIPQNLHIIGTMNTADRSLSMVDYALRRRFAFVDVTPGFAVAGFQSGLNDIGVDAELRDRIVKRTQRLNERISEDPSLGSGFCIGHSYFCHGAEGTADQAWYERIVRTEIGPLLREYWFDNRERAEEEIARLLNDD